MVQARYKKTGGSKLSLTKMNTKRKRTTLAIDGTDSPAGSVRPEFLSFTLDFWPNSEPGWYGSSILHLDLQNPRLINAGRALSPSFLRIGGWEADRVVYLMDDDAATPWQKVYCASNPDFCLTKEKWDEIFVFAQQINARIVFCLAYLLYIAEEAKDWNGSNAFQLLEYTSHNAPQGLLYGIELGNEPLHKGRSNNVTRHVLAYSQLREYIDTLWSGSLQRYRPKLMGPSTTGVNKNTFGQFFQFEEYCDMIDVATYHDYRCGSGRNENLSAEAILPGSFATHNKLHHAAKMVEEALVRDDKEIWIGEGSMAYNSGRENVTDTLQSSFWYANILGQLSKTRHMTHSVFCRQALVGGWYDLLSHSDNLEPNPDYWLAVIWKELMGTTSLFSERIGCCQEGSDRLLVHAFCARHSSSKYNMKEGDVAMVLINIADDISYEATMDETSDVWDAESRLEFLLQAEDGTESPLAARRISINGQPMRLGPQGEIPDIAPFEKHDPDAGMILPPYSIMFAVLRGAKSSLCMEDSSKNGQAAEQKQQQQTLQQQHVQTDIVQYTKAAKRTNLILDHRLLRSRPTIIAGDSIGTEYGFVIILTVIAFGGILFAMKASSRQNRGRGRRQKRRLHHAR